MEGSPTPLPLSEGRGEGSAYRLSVASAPRLECEPPTSTDCRLSDLALDLAPETYSVLSEACDWLADFLSAGPRPAREVLSAARAGGFPPITLRRAKLLLKVQSRKHASAWSWLPDPSPGQDAQLDPQMS